jgi:hypothetical protein
MDVELDRHLKWWALLLVAIGLVAVGAFGYILVSGELDWHGTEVLGAREAMAHDMGDYVRVEGTVALNASEDIVITERDVTKAVWTDQEYDYNVPHIWVEDPKGATVLVLFDHVTVTKPGRHDGDYHKGDEVCIGGTVAVEGTGLKALRADFVAKHREDTPARLVGYYIAAMFGGMMIVLALALARLFLKPKAREGLDWRGE